MSRKKIEIRVSSLASSRLQAGAYTLLLNEVNGKRALPIIIGTSEAQAIAIELRGITPPRPLTHMLFASVLEALDIRLLRMLIYKAEDGVYYSYLYLRSGEIFLRADSRTSDAVAMSLRMKVPILIYEDVLDAACTMQDSDIALHPEANEHLSGPYAMQSLETALQKAVEDENYELAAHLRDLINQMKTS